MQLDVGQRFDRYQIVRKLGMGISGESYEAQDTLLQRTVTLKLIHPWSTLPDATRRQFFREMQTMSLLNHPGIASILDYSDVDRQLYLAHKYTPLGSLLGPEGRTWFSPPLPIEDAIHYTVQLTQPLSYLHYNGFFHGALTLANILIQHDPAHSTSPTTQFLLADASLAHFVRRYGHPVMTHLPITAAPEQFYKRMTAASDQYALASLLYYWLAACPPFLGSPEEIKQQKLHTTPLPLSTHNPLVPQELAQVVQRALSTSIEDRFPSLQAFADALQQADQPPAPEEETDPELPSVLPAWKQESNGHTNNLEIAEPSSEVLEETTPVLTSLNPIEVQEANGHISDLEIADLAAEPLFAPIDIPDPDPDPESAPVESAPAAQNEFLSASQPQSLPEISQPADTAEIQQDPPINTVPDAAEALVEHPVTSLPDPADSPQEPSVDEPPAVTDSPQDLPVDEPLDVTAIDPEVAEAAPSPIPSHPHFIITSPYAETPYEVIIDREEMTIGRAGSSDILLDYDPFTSRHHALLQKRDERYILSDRRSAYGTSVNGQQLLNEQHWPLQEGDQISIGQYKLVFCASPTQEARTQTPQNAQI
ncbi:MAG TPA: FHA domain-containing protein [Ktedonobacteraceae bacterium]|nr:FHA domain-containing protein [Ktedonobacteraceae bacterium]